MEITKAEWRKEYLQKLEKKVTDLGEKRFHGNVKKAFQEIKKITKYDQYRKREGGIHSRVKQDGKTIVGAEAERLIMSHYK